MGSALEDEPSELVKLSEAAAPAPVNHLVDRDSIIIRTHLGAAVLSAVGVVVAYEADAIDPVTRTGWSVIVTGVAKRAFDLDEAVRARAEAVGGRVDGPPHPDRARGGDRVRDGRRSRRGDRVNRAAGTAHTAVTTSPDRRRGWSGPGRALDQPAVAVR